MSGKTETVNWALKRLRKLDWVARHENLSKIRRRNPLVWNAICEESSPDEVLFGKRTSVYSLDEVIVAKDKETRQMRLDEFFR